MTRISTTWAVSLVALALCMSIGDSAWGAFYTVIDLSPDDHASGYGAGGAQQVGMSGFSIYSDGRAVLWYGAASSCVNLHPGGFDTSEAWATNGTQQVGVGVTSSKYYALLWSGTAASCVNLGLGEALGIGGIQQAGDRDGLATLWTGTAASAVNLNPSGFSKSYAYSTDGTHQAGAGYGEATGNNNHALLWSGTANSYVDLNPSGLVVSSAASVSGTQQVGYGSSSGSYLDDHALLWTGTAASAIDLNPAGFTQSYASSTNGTLQVGEGYGDATGGNWHALLWNGTAGSCMDLNQFLSDGLMTSWASAIAANGDVVGSAGSHAILWKRVWNLGDANNDNVVDVVDLNNVFNSMGTQGWGLAGDTNGDDVVDVLDLNNVYNNLGTEAATGGEVPEPATISLLALGGLWLIRRGSK